MEQQQTATDRLAESVRDLAAKLPTFRTPMDQWQEASPKKKAGVIAAIMAVLYSPELLKEIFGAIGKLIIEILPRLMHH